MSMEWKFLLWLPSGLFCSFVALSFILLTVHRQRVVLLSLTERLSAQRFLNLSAETRKAAAAIDHTHGGIERGVSMHANYKKLWRLSDVPISDKGCIQFLKVCSMFGVVSKWPLYCAM